MANNTRIYVVTEANGPAHLVEAASQAQAIGHVVRNRYTAEVASQLNLVNLLSAGKTVEKAGE